MRAADGSGEPNDTTLCGRVAKALTVKDAEGKPTPWIKTDTAESVFGGLILLNAIVLGVDIEICLQNGGQSGPILMWIQIAFLVIFVFELCLRVIADGKQFVFNIAGVFDACIIFVSMLEYALIVPFGMSTGVGESPLAAVSVMRIFRLLRIARIVRVLHIFPELALLVSGLAASMQAVFWVLCLLVVIMYIGSLICAMELGHEVEDAELRDYFGSVGASFYSHFMIVTLEGYPDIAKAAGYQSPFWYLYICCFIIFSSMVLMNLVTGIVCESVVDNARNDELASHMYEAESAKFIEVLEELILSQGHKPDQDIKLPDFKELVKFPAIRETLNTFDICLEIDDEDLFQIIDEDGSGSLSLGEFCNGLLRLRGSKEAIHSLLVQSDLVRHTRMIREQLRDSEENINQYAVSLCAKLQSKLNSNFRSLGAEVASATSTAARQVEVRRAAACKVFPLEEVTGPWSIMQRFHLHGEEEKELITNQVRMLDSADSITSAVRYLNLGDMKCEEGCCVVYSKSSHAYFLLYHEHCQAIACEILTSVAQAKAALDDGELASKSSKWEQLLPCPPCLQELLQTAEASAAKTRAVLNQLGSELEASRARVRCLEQRLLFKDEAVQTDVHHSLSEENDVKEICKSSEPFVEVQKMRGAAPHDKLSRDSAPCWVEEEEEEAKSSTSPLVPEERAEISPQVPEHGRLHFNSSPGESPPMFTPRRRRTRPQASPRPGFEEQRSTDRRRRLQAAASGPGTHLDRHAAAGPSSEHLETKRRLIERFNDHASASTYSKQLGLNATYNVSDSEVERLPAGRLASSGASGRSSRSLTTANRLRRQLAITERSIR